ncbi:MAG: response regulator [Dysgonamonadaceae bacterium]
MIEDNAGRLYMSTPSSLSIYDKKNQTFSTITTDDGKILPAIRMIKTKKGYIYVSTNGRGLYYIDYKTNTLKKITYNAASDRYYYYYYTSIPALMEDKDLNLWLGTFKKGILTLQGNPKQFGSLEFSNIKDRSGSVINSILKDYDGNIFYSANGYGVYKINHSRQNVTHFNNVQDVINLYEDSYNTLWISSHSKGLAKMNKNTGQIDFSNIPFNKELNLNNYINTMVEGRDSCLYISTFSTGFIRYNIKTGKYARYDMKQKDTGKGKLDNNWINAMLCDSEGLIWLGHANGVTCFNPRTNSFIKFKNKELLSKQACILLMEGDNNTIWIGTFDGLFCLNKKTGVIFLYDVNKGLSNNVICGLGKDKFGNVWCSTFDGINKIIPKENKVVNYYMGNGLVDKIYSLGVYFVDKKGMIYFGGNNGITFFQPEKILTSPIYKSNIITTNVYIDNKLINTNTQSGGKQIIKTKVEDAKEFSFAFQDNTVTFEFSTMDFNDHENIFYEYRIKSLSNKWYATLPGVNQITYYNLDPGKYTLEVRASKYGVYSPVKYLTLNILPPWYRSFWAYLIYTLIIISIGLLIADILRKKRVELINESKLRFFTNISHELRSPLTLLVSPLEILLQGNFDQQTQTRLRSMYRNVNRLLNLVNQILDIRKIDKGQMKLKYTETEMVGFIQEAFSIFEEQSIQRKIHFEFKHPTNSLLAWIDRNNFDKILINLLSNAFKYTPDGGEIIISLSTKENKSPLRNYFEISVTDSGIGLCEDEIEKIFDRFYQGDNQEAFTTSSGIGLNLAKTLVHLHHGTIRANNRTDGTKGSCFSLSIPLGKEHVSKEDLAEEVSNTRPVLKQQHFIPELETKKKSDKKKKNYKILVVDDDIDIRDFFKQELSDLYKVITATNGYEALEMASTQSPDLIISDVIMPQMDGLTLVKNLKGNNSVCQIPIILLTSKVEFKDKTEGLNKGADGYIPKPFNIEELLAVINNLILNRNILKGKFSGEQEQKGRIKNIEKKSDNEVLMERIMNVVNENIGNSELNVEFLVTRVGVSRVQLHRKMKEVTGFSTIDFIRNMRMKQAPLLLIEKGLDVSRTAYSVGFVSPTHFSTVFKKYYGVSPSEYIEMHRSPQYEMKYPVDSSPCHTN